ncbi:hypothetical protein MSG28_012908 [Choristoneura fumiferana]|uniref:Uncharacterized protein n=1 Tax=Choristoneura fumiferana TaxID=7141 RepID=A0ACC0KSI8_CHOFU|nr:hypothetical protein MSG28_012908 [Choristoneura fumiferana]
MVARAARAQWGLNSAIVKTIYQAVVEPTVLYAAGAWGHVVERAYAIKRLDRITRQFAIKIAKAHSTASLTSCVLLAGILPLDIRIKEQLAIYTIKRGKELGVLPGRRLQRPLHPSQLPHPADRRELISVWGTSLGVAIVCLHSGCWSKTG